MSITLTTKVSEKVDERFSISSLTDQAVNQDFKWQGAHAITTNAWGTAALKTYGRGKTADADELVNTPQTMALRMDEYFKYVLEEMNVEETSQTLLGSIKRQIDEVIVPTIDEYRLKMLSAAVDTTHKRLIEDTDLEADGTAYKEFLKLSELLTDSKVPLSNRFAFVTPEFLNFIKLSPAFIKSTDLGQSMLTTGVVGMIDGTKIILTPKPYLTISGTVHNCIITHKSVMVAPVKLNYVKVVANKNTTDYFGDVVMGRVYYDSFVLNSKKMGIAASVHKPTTA